MKIRKNTKARILARDILMRFVINLSVFSILSKLY